MLFFVLKHYEKLELNIIIYSAPTNISGMEYPTPEALFQETNQLVEKWSEIMCFLATIVIPTFVCFSMVMLSFFFYFTTDLGSDAFELPVPMWYD